jgi:hypothetical protein
MKSLGKFVSITVGGLVAMMVLGMIGAAMFNIKPQEVKALNLITDWFWYRLAFYCFFMLSWIPLCNYVTRPKKKTVDVSEQIKAKAEEKRIRAFNYMKKQWWKLALFLVFFEIVIIRQFGL